MYKIKILCAEDDEATRYLMKKKMIAKGWEVIEVADGVEAFEMYKRYKPDLIILDVHMPRCSGLKVLKAIRASDLWTPIIIYSSLTRQEDLDAGLIYGANVYFTKDFNIDSLVLQVKNLLKEKYAEVLALANGITYNITSAELKIGERCHQLNSLESKVFEILCRNKNKLCQKDMLLTAGWKNTDANIEAQLYKQIGQLKQILKDAKNVEIVLDRGKGYYLKIK